MKCPLPPFIFFQTRHTFVQKQSHWFTASEFRNKMIEYFFHCLGSCWNFNKTQQRRLSCWPWVGNEFIISFRTTSRSHWFLNKEWAIKFCLQTSVVSSCDFQHKNCAHATQQARVGLAQLMKLNENMVEMNSYCVHLPWDSLSLRQSMPNNGKVTLHMHMYTFTQKLF